MERRYESLPPLFVSSSCYLLLLLRTQVVDRRKNIFNIKKIGILYGCGSMPFVLLNDSKSGTDEISQIYKIQVLYTRMNPCYSFEQLAFFVK